MRKCLLCLATSFLNKIIFLQVGLAVVNGQLYAVGGFDGTTYLKTIEVFDQVQNKHHSS